MRLYSFTLEALFYRPSIESCLTICSTAMSIKDHVLEGSEWSQGDYIDNLPGVSDGYCRALVIYWLYDIHLHKKISVADNFKSLIKSHVGNLGTIAKSQEDTDKIGSLNALEMANVHLLQVTQGVLSVNTGAVNVTWLGPQAAGTPGGAVRSALNQSVRSMCLVHIEWDGWLWTSVGSGAHAIGVVSEPGGSAGDTFTVFDPNYGIMRAYGVAGIDTLMQVIRNEYSANRLAALPLM